MTLNLKFRTCFITFMLLISSFTFLFVDSDSVKADDPSDLFGDIFNLDDIFDLIQLIKLAYEEILLPHPYRVIGAYYINETMNITGDVIFDLFFSSTIIQQFGERFQDEINVSLHHWDYNTLSVSEIENASLTIQLDPDFSDIVYKQGNVVLKNINHTLYEGDYLLISVEIIQSKKLIYNIVEKAYEKTLRPLIETLANFFNNSKDPTISQIGGIVKEALSVLEAAGIGVEEIAYLFNSLTSSSFYYGSDSYKSSVIIPLSNSENDTTLYFHNMFHELDTFGLGNIKTVNETKPSSSTDNVWPPISFDFESETGGMEFASWFIIWLIYNLEEVIFTEEDIVTYYLNRENKLVKDEPTASSPARFKLKKDTEYKWDGMTFSRNKIIKNATAELYMYYAKMLFLRKITVNVTLYDETAGKAIDTVEKQLDRTKILELLLRRPGSPTIFEFTDAEGEEIWFNHDYSLIVSYTGAPLLTLRQTHLLCDSYTYPSSITFHFKETDNINITKGIEDKEIIPGASAKYELNIESEHADNLNIEVYPENPNDLEAWSIEYDDSVDINAGEQETVDVTVTSLDNSITAYGQKIDLIFTVTGNTGFDSKEAKVTVSENAAEYDMIVDVPPRKEIKHGTTETYVFKIKNNNTGFLEDMYEITASSEHDWPIELDYDETSIVETGEELFVNVTASVPAYTKISSDKLTLTITSTTSEHYGKDKTVVVVVNTKVITPNILESIYRFFESTAKKLGLDEVLGGYAAAFLIFIVIFIIIIFLLVIIYIIRLKYVKIICLERITEIKPDEKAEYNIIVQNPYKRKLTYELKTEVNSDPESWDICLDTENVILESKEEQAIKITIEPTDFVKKDEWVEVKLTVKPIEKKKIAEISTVTSIKDAKPDIRILGVLHWPKVFKKGERIVTSFRIHNRGNASTDKVSVILYVNGKEKNKVEDITIPRGAYAEIEIPWIAVKGKNEVNIVVK